MKREELQRIRDQARKLAGENGRAASPDDDPCFTRAWMNLACAADALDAMMARADAQELDDRMNRVPTDIEVARARNPPNAPPCPHCGVAFADHLQQDRCRAFFTLGGEWILPKGTGRDR